MSAEIGACTALYIHLPFCQTKCHYCAFSSYPGLETLIPRYMTALRSELRSVAEQRERCEQSLLLRSVFLGGGTPTLVSCGELVSLLAEVKACFEVAPGAEITIEANPETIGYEGFKHLHQAGFNRLSLGVQSLSARDLRLLGRTHSPERAVGCLAEARRAGFDNCNLDLMSALPGQHPASWAKTLDTTLSHAPDHLAVYQLTLEEQTPLANHHAQGGFSLPTEEEIEAIDSYTAASCQKAGLVQYEIANFARVGRYCQHNLVYWRNEPYDGIGAGAVSYDGRRRAIRVADPLRYCEVMEVGKSPVVESETLDMEAQFRETVVMGLRLIEGVERKRLQQRYNIDPVQYYGDKLRMLVDQDLVNIDEHLLCLSPMGRRLANRVLMELV